MDQSLDFSKYKKIAVVGSPGSGKSWVSKRLAKHTGYPLYHLDREYWNPEWTPTPKADWLEKQKNITSQSCWIIDGNYDSTLELRLQAADLVLFLDLPRGQCLWSVLKRRWGKRTDFPTYLEEPKIYEKEFYEFLQFVWRFPKEGRKSIVTLLEQYPDTKVITFSSRKMTTLFAETLSFYE